MILISNVRISAYCILRKMRNLRIGCVSVQYMRKILSQCGIYAQDCTYFPNVQYMRKIVLLSQMRNICARFVQDCTSFSNVQYMLLRKIVLLSSTRKIVLLSPMCNIWQYMRKICARFAQDCTYFSNVQYMCKICARLYFFPQCTIYVQDLRKIVLISPMRNICARFAQDCTSFPNAQYMCKICARLYLFLQCAILV